MLIGIDDCRFIPLGFDYFTFAIQELRDFI